MKKYEKAKAEDDEVFLMAFQKVHRKARMVLDHPGMKERIKKVIDNRIATTKRQMYFKAFYAIANYFEHFSDDPVGIIFSRTLADIAPLSNFRTFDTSFC